MRIASKISILILFLFVSSQASAQRGKKSRTRKSTQRTEKRSNDRDKEANRSDVRKSKGSLEFRIQGGTTIPLTDIVNNFDNNDLVFGYQGGVGVTYYFTPSIKMRFGVLYKNRSFHRSGFSSSTRYDLQHITTPAVFEYQPNKLSFFFGPHFNYLFKAERSFRNSDSQDAISFFSRISYGPQLGMGYDLIQSGIVLRLEGYIQAEFDFVAPGLNLVVGL